MAGPRRRGPPPLPPPLGGIVVAGSNVIASSRAFPLERLDLVTGWLQAWRPDLPITVFLDWSTAVRCRPPVQAVLRARCEDVSPQRPRYVVCPRHEPADEFLLAHAQQQAALVVSNDRFFDHDELRKNLVLVQFDLSNTTLRMHDDAVWFRSPGTAEWVAMATLQTLRGNDGDGASAGASATAAATDGAGADDERPDQAGFGDGVPGIAPGDEPPSPR
jgi:hypothetical protein